MEHLGALGQGTPLAPPPDAQATATELQELRALAGQRDAAAAERIRYWDFWSPAYRWNELLIDTRVARTASGPTDCAPSPCWNVAIHDALIAAWDSKYAHNRPRPGSGSPTRHRSTGAPQPVLSV